MKLVQDNIGREREYLVIVPCRAVPCERDSQPCNQFTFYRIATEYVCLCMCACVCGYLVRHGKLLHLLFWTVSICYGARKSLQRRAWSPEREKLIFHTPFLSHHRQHSPLLNDVCVCVGVKGCTFFTGTTAIVKFEPRPFTLVCKRPVWCEKFFRSAQVQKVTNGLW